MSRRQSALAFRPDPIPVPKVGIEPTTHTGSDCFLVIQPVLHYSYTDSQSASDNGLSAVCFFSEKFKCFCPSCWEEEVSCQKEQ